MLDEAAPHKTSSHQRDDRAEGILGSTNEQLSSVGGKIACHDSFRGRRESSFSGPSATGYTRITNSASNYHHHKNKRLYFFDNNRQKIVWIYRVPL